MRRDQSGIVLIASLAVLLMLTLLAVGMFRGFGLEERITGNTREKQHAFYAAQSALQNAESWLAGGNAGLGTACSLTNPAPTAQICTQATTPTQQTLATTLWNGNFGTTFVPPAVTIGGVATQQLLATQYFADPQFAITYLGADPSGQGTLYQVTSIGYGGSANAVAVVQSVYSVSSGTTVVSR